MRTIYIPLDGSAFAERSLGLGLEIAQAYRARIALIHVLDEPIANDLPSIMATPDRVAIEAYLRRISEDLPADVPAFTHILRGNPAQALIRLTEDDPDSMLVMSTHGRSGISRLMLGSVADQVIRQVTVPVALVRIPATPQRHRLNTIMVPLDASSYSESALPFAIDLAQRTDATIGLVHVCEPFWVSPYVAAVPELAQINDARTNEVDRESLAEGRAYLDRIASDIRAEGVRVVWEVRFGKPADEIMRAARTTEADLIVMATHDRAGLRRMALGSVTNEILRRGQTPVFAIVPHLIQQQEQHIAELLSSI